MQEDEIEVDISLLSEKEKNKILIQRARDMERAKAKVEREAKKAKDKAMKVAERQLKKVGRSKKSQVGDASSPALVVPEASTGSMSQNPRKRDSSFVQLSASRLQQCTSPAFQDCSGGTLHLNELFLCTSLDVVMSYFEEHHAFLKEWLEMQAFFEKVFFVSCVLLLHDVIVVVF